MSVEMSTHPYLTFVCALFWIYCNRSHKPKRKP